MEMVSTVGASVTCRVISESDMSVWCERCLLPSAVRMTFAIEIDGSPLALNRVEACHDCGSVRSI